MTDPHDGEINRLAQAMMATLEKELGVKGGDTISNDVILPVVCALGVMAGHAIGMCEERVRGNLFRLHTQVVLDTIDETTEEPETVR